MKFILFYRKKTMILVQKIFEKLPKKMLKSEKSVHFRFVILCAEGSEFLTDDLNMVTTTK